MMDTLKNILSQLNISDAVYNNFYNAVTSGENVTLHHTVSQATNIDEDWVTTVNAALFYVEEIAKNPKKFLMENEVVVNVEKARRTGAKTVRYLSSHTNDIASIERNGDVRPKRVLTSQIEEDIAIYENRFIYTLIKRLVPFVEMKYNEIMGNVSSENINTVGLSSKFTYGDSKFDYSFTLTATEPSDDTVTVERNNKLIEDIVYMRKRLIVLQSTDFCKKLSASKQIVPPINKTNMIKMNVNYSNAYKLWLFITAYQNTGVSVQVREKDLPVDGDYFADLAIVTALAAKSYVDNEKGRREVYDAVEYSQRKEKNFKVVSSYNLTPTFGRDKKTADDGAYDYYFQRIRQAFSESKEYPKHTSKTIVEEKDLKISFAKFYRSVTAISNDMYNDVINGQTGEEVKEGEVDVRTPLQKKTEQYKKQKNMYSRLMQLSKLKEEEYERTLKQVTRELAKLDKLKEQLDDLEGKTQAKKAKEKAKREAEKAKLASRKGNLKKRVSEYGDNLRNKKSKKEE